MVSNNISHQQAQNPGPYQRIYAIVTQIPSGTVATYGQIARLVGKCSARMVGYAMSALPDHSEVPWHRVINHKGEISKRKNGYGDIIQRKLLEAEGVRFNRRGRINFRNVLWRGPYYL